MRPQWRMDPRGASDHLRAPCIVGLRPHVLVENWRPLDISADRPHNPRIQSGYGLYTEALVGNNDAASGVAEGATHHHARHGTLQQTAYDAIKRQILTGRVSAGSPLSEEGLAAELSMSRTPVRQAMLELLNQGLLERVHGRGFWVSRIDIRRVLEITEIQQMLLEWCAPRICQRADRDLSDVVTAFDQQLDGIRRVDHTQVLLEARRMDIAVVRLVGNNEMTRIMKEISDLLVHAASQTLTSTKRMEEAVREHEAIVRSLEAGDGTEALTAVQRHCAGVRRRLLGSPA